MRLKKLFINSMIVMASTFIGLLLSEMIARSFLNPADYLSASLKKHEILGGVVEPNTNGLDEWGYRNRAVPTKVDIVAIGDSHTYGNTAKMEESWPYVAGRLTGQIVYNMGMGGYGPNQYYYLLNSRALGLKPGIVLCGLYMGDDFENAFTMTYGLDYWSFLRKHRFEGVDANIWGEQDDSKYFGDMRAWLSKNSVIYQIIFHGPVMSSLKGYIQVFQASRENDPFTTTLIVEDEKIREAFRPSGIRDRVDQNRKEVREGMLITMKLLQDMNETCLKSGIRFVVVVIPTKEMVFADYLEHNSKIYLGETIDELLSNERQARKELFEYFHKNAIRYVDTLPAMTGMAGHELYARSHRDMHPGRNGYRVIAETVVEYLKKNDLLHQRDDDRGPSANR
jgi:hypothetical protein